MDGTEITLRPVMDVRAHLQAKEAIDQVLKYVMKNGIHYGTIPGCGDKPVLLKPGAEAILSTFGIRPEIHVEEFREEGHYRYRVRCVGRSMAGDFLGEGVGECSTAEEKYMWERAASEDHWKETPPDMRRKRWRRGKSPWQEMQVRTNPPDKAPICVKMAKKRALVDLCLTTTGASDMFVQDIDEEHLRTDDQVGAPEPIKPPQAKPRTAPARSHKAEPAGGDGLVVQGNVSQLAKKEGTSKAGKPFTRYGIRVGNDWFNTFDSSFFDAAEAAKNTGRQVAIVYQQTEYGKDVQSISVLGGGDDPPEQAAMPINPVTDYEQIRAAYMALPDDKREAIRAEYKIRLITDVQKWDPAGVDDFVAALRKAGAPF